MCDEQVNTLQWDLLEAERNFEILSGESKRLQVCNLLSLNAENEEISRYLLNPRFVTITSDYHGIGGIYPYQLVRPNPAPEILQKIRIHCSHYSFDYCCNKYLSIFPPQGHQQLIICLKCFPLIRRIYRYNKLTIQLIHEHVTYHIHCILCSKFWYPCCELLQMEEKGPLAEFKSEQTIYIQKTLENEYELY